MLKVLAWTYYDLGKAYGFKTNDGQFVKNDNGNVVDECGHTYIRMVFTFDTTIISNLQVMEDNLIDWKNLTNNLGYFTSDITYFPNDYLNVMKNCIIDEMEALLNINSDSTELRDYLKWFIRNIDTTEAKYFETEIDPQVLKYENEMKKWYPLFEIYSRMNYQNPFRKIIDGMYPNIQNL